VLPRVDEDPVACRCPSSQPPLVVARSSNATWLPVWTAMAMCRWIASSRATDHAWTWIRSCVREVARIVRRPDPTGSVLLTRPEGARICGAPPSLRASTLSCSPAWAWPWGVGLRGVAALTPCRRSSWPPPVLPWRRRRVGSGSWPELHAAPPGAAATRRCYDAVYEAFGRDAQQPLSPAGSGPVAADLGMPPIWPLADISRANPGISSCGSPRRAGSKRERLPRRTASMASSPLSPPGNDPSSSPPRCGGRGHHGFVG